MSFDVDFDMAKGQKSPTLREFIQGLKEVAEQVPEALDCEVVISSGMTDILHPAGVIVVLQKYETLAEATGVMSSRVVMIGSDLEKMRIQKCPRYYAAMMMRAGIAGKN